MLEPLKQTNEVALTVNDEDKIVTATSFHHSDAVGGGSDGSGGSENMVLAALAAGVMKPETSIVCDEFDAKAKETLMVIGGVRLVLK